ncbi:hypothetical protein THASP1DRAFT_32797 [Thamnocephalis sphaerospora]|uniref:Uncharacterized protein n=1 Tax=Thamnocephalis sphaerospora TaxID=78915 RepID=A0A4P9XI66_9FUNG|nr:hypothetical protein THASP1DRAFT_32797 [Thamnocephalis sphaerospora]|eukprot:RKP05363.1 hypothetical protein THASP1DRAFT_32797 [Thamnocephalis sphaerospora]
MLIRFVVQSSEHQRTREQMLVAQTSLEHQNQRVGELEVKLQTTEARLREYERPATADGSAEHDTEEARLKQELSKLRVELVEAKRSSEKAAEQIEQYKAISAASEEALRSLQSTADEFKVSADKKHAEQEVGCDIANLLLYAANFQ